MSRDRLGRVSLESTVMNRSVRRPSSGRGTRVLALERLETRTVLAGDSLPPLMLLALDVSGDGTIAPSDALQVINELNSRGPQDLGTPRQGASSQEAQPVGGEGELATDPSWLRRFDVNGDDWLTPADALTIINRINDVGSQEIQLGDLLGEIAHELSLEQQASIETLVRSLQGLRDKSGITDEQILELANDLTALVSEAGDPTQEQIDALKDSFFRAIEDGDLSSSDIDELKGQLQELLVNLDVDPERVEAFITKWVGWMEESDLTVEDLDTLLVQVESVVNAFAPGALDLPRAELLLAIADVWLDQVPTWLSSPAVNPSNPGSFQQVASRWLGLYTRNALN